jgi:hypothetical protein
VGWFLDGFVGRVGEGEGREGRVLGDDLGVEKGGIASFLGFAILGLKGLSSFSI